MKIKLKKEKSFEFRSIYAMYVYIKAETHTVVTMSAGCMANVYGHSNDAYVNDR